MTAAEDGPDGIASKNVAIDHFENPYFAAVAGAVTVGRCRADLSEAGVEAARARDELVREFAWAIPNEAAIRTLVAHDPLLEVGAGLGYWAWCVQQAGGDVVATDPCPPPPEGDLDPYVDVRPLDATTAIERFGAGRALFVCWPGQERSWPADALAAYDGSTVVYVGCGRGSCNADHDFHRRLFDDFRLAETVAIPTFATADDRLEVWTRAGG